MSNDGTGLREARIAGYMQGANDHAAAALDQARLRVDAEEDANHAALSAVAPPPALARERAADPGCTDSFRARLLELAEQADMAMEGEWFGTNHVETSGCEAEFIAWCKPLAIIRLLREYELFRAALAASPAAPAQPEGGDAVGETGSMPGTAGFTMACFNAADVPVGTKLYTRPAPAQQAVTDGVEVVRIDRSERLDPITVYLADEGGGRGRMTIVCYNQAWTCYWGAMGNRTLREFVARCDASYVSGNMLSGLVSEDSDFAYAGRVAEAVIAALASNAAASAADAQERA